MRLYRKAFSLSLIHNSRELVHNARTDVTGEARKTALLLLETAISAVDPRQLLRSRVTLRNATLTIDDLQLHLTDYRRIIVVGGGKASGAMAESLEDLLGPRIDAGLINVPEGSSRLRKDRIIEVNEAGHPIPTEQGQRGVTRILDLLKTVDEATLVIFLLSGGGSALLPSPPPGVTLDEQKQVTNLLLKCGATINEINVVRKHVSRIKGGRLAVASYPATLLCLILSDVIGDPLSSIASGPTVPDPSTYADAIHVLQRYGIWEDTPPAVRLLLDEGVRGRREESPKPGDPRFAKVRNVVLGNNAVALEAAARQATALGFTPLLLSSYVSGEARHVGTVFAAIARELMVRDNPVPKPAVLLAGGETTVTVTGTGRGGRNGELALNASLGLAGLDGVALASVGTDGIDGVSDSAGAIVDGFTLERARALDLNPLDYLQNNDSHHFFHPLKDLLYTGPTGTNVNDLLIVVGLAPSRARPSGGVK
jgi:glycerate 2-kinase